MLSMIMGPLIAQAIRTVAELGVADHLASGPRSAGELAKSADCSVSDLQRLLRVLCGLGVFRQVGTRYELTPLSEYLRRDRPDNLWAAASWFGNEMYRALGGLPLTVREGVPAWTHAIGLSYWDYLAAHPDRGLVFDTVIATLCGDELPAIVNAYSFPHGATVMDVGGGAGALLAAVLREHEGLRGILFDLPGVVGRSRIGDTFRGLTARCEFEAGSFFETVPAGADLYMLRHILHDWEDASCVQILKHCAQALRADGILLVIEAMVKDAGATSTSFVDVGMMVSLPGRERTADEYQDLFASSGLQLMRMIRTHSAVSILECRRACR